MRSGKLLAEASPASLLQRFGASNLEEVFLELSAHQDGVHHLIRLPAEVSAISPTLPDEPIAPIVHMGDNALPMNEIKSKPQTQRPPPSKTTAFKGRIKALLAKSFLRILRHAG